MYTERDGVSEPISRYQVEIYRVLTNPDPLHYLDTTITDPKKYRFGIRQKQRLLEDVADPSKKAEALAELTWHSLPDFHTALREYSEYGVPASTLLEEIVLSSQEFFVSSAAEASNRSKVNRFRQNLRDTIETSCIRVIVDTYSLDEKGIGYVRDYHDIRREFKKRNMRSAKEEDFTELAQIYQERFQWGLESSDFLTRVKTERNYRKSCGVLQTVHRTFFGQDQNIEDMENITVTENPLYRREMLERREALRSALLRLPPREGEVIAKRFDTQKATLEEIAKTKGISRERVREIERRALRSLRHPVRAKKLLLYRGGISPETAYSLSSKKTNLPEAIRTEPSNNLYYVWGRDRRIQKEASRVATKPLEAPKTSTIHKPACPHSSTPLGDTTYSQVGGERTIIDERKDTTTQTRPTPEEPRLQDIQDFIRTHIANARKEARKAIDELRKDFEEFLQ